MRVLFIHPSFPGPFRGLASCFGAMAGTTALFLTERRRHAGHIPGVRRLLMAAPELELGYSSSERESLIALRRGANAANAMLKLQKEGFVPDIICTASGPGAGFYAADIFPRAFRVAYADWFYTKGAYYTFFEGARSPEEFAPLRVRNLIELNALDSCHLAISPTAWQKAQFPDYLASRIQVMPQGVDTRFFSPAPETLCLNDEIPAELLTFVVRSLEPYRGFPHFARSLPRLLEARPQCHVLIMSASPPRNGEPDPASLLQSLDLLTEDQLRRVHFPGFCPSEEYRRILRASTLHVYLTAPYALSAGLLEAMSCGCLLLAADTEPVREVLRHGENGFLCDFRDPDQLAAMMIQTLEQGKRNASLQKIRCAARQSVLDHYDSQRLAPLQFAQVLNAWEEERKL